MIVQGNRNSKLTELTVHLYTKNILYHSDLVEIILAVNNKLCDPPLSAEEVCEIVDFVESRV